MFWRSVNLTGNQTITSGSKGQRWFWRSVNLTGNQTLRLAAKHAVGFGAVSI